MNSFPVFVFSPTLNFPGWFVIPSWFIEACIVCRFLLAPSVDALSVWMSVPPLGSITLYSASTSGITSWFPDPGSWWCLLILVLLIPSGSALGSNQALAFFRKRVIQCLAFFHLTLVDRVFAVLLGSATPTGSGSTTDWYTFVCPLLSVSPGYSR